MEKTDSTPPSFSRLGALLDRLLGPPRITTVEGPAKTRLLTIREEQKPDDTWPAATLRCSRVIYKTTYDRWWIPSISSAKFTVSIDVAQELKDRYGEEAFTSASYPVLCIPMLQWTTYPHVCAILAYLDELAVRLGGSVVGPRSILL